MKGGGRHINAPCFPLPLVVDLLVPDFDDVVDLEVNPVIVTERYSVDEDEYLFDRDVLAVDERKAAVVVDNEDTLVNVATNDATRIFGINVAIAPPSKIGTVERKQKV